jgi:Xaa-Pro aminopeptidase
MQEAIREENLDGWLFCNFHHRDELTDSLLDLDRLSVSTRRWFYFVPASGNPVKIVHAIEKKILDSLPGDSFSYTGKIELERLLARFRGLTAAILSDENIQVLSTFDAASASLAASCGIRTVSAASLVQRFRGILDQEGIDSHGRAADILYSIVDESWKCVCASFRDQTSLFEGDIQNLMLDRFRDTGLITDHAPIVGAGRNSGNPHYSVPGEDLSVPGRGKRLEKGDVLQFDLWAKESGGIYADISWIGYCGTVIPQSISNRANLVFAARNLVKPAVEAAIADDKTITGASLDSIVREFLLARTPAESVQHRTGHGIDTECHGSGVNIDSIEFPDHRYLLEGSCFSVEPGIYFSDCGFRTEIDIYLHNKKPVISGREIQQALLQLQDE